MHTDPVLANRYMRLRADPGPLDVRYGAGIVRIGTRCDAADVSFATMFGTLTSQAPVVHVSALDDPPPDSTPQHSKAALSTSGIE